MLLLYKKINRILTMAKDKKTVLKLRSWYSNKYQIVSLQKKLLAVFSVCAMVTVVIAVIFVKQFTESKSFEPYLIEFEEKTGKLNVVENLNTTTLTADEAIKKSYLNSFLEVAEGYNPVTFASDMRTLLLLSNNSVFRKVMNKHNKRNDRSTVNLLGNYGKLTIKIKSIIFTTPTLANIRFVVYSTRPSKTFPAQKHLIANIEFGFYNMELNQEDRFRNPLGFRVTKYDLGEDINI